MASSDYGTLSAAIRQKLIVTATYHGHYREFCPHVIGTKKGKQHVLGFQFAGSGSSGLAPGGEWRCFDVATLSSVSTRTGPWRTRPVHTQPQTCVDNIDVEVSY
jgi:hypothetical protein